MSSATSPDLARQLSDGLARLGLGIGQEGRQALTHYLDLLQRWNRVYNLTAVRDSAQMVTRHILDSLSAARFVQGARVLDVGTGAGLPGIPLALAFPRWRFVLLDSAVKKTRFVTQVVAELALSNVTVVHSRVEDYHPGLPFDTAVCRAFSSLGDLVARTRHLYHPRSRLIAMKGEYPLEELAAIPSDFELNSVTAVRVPGLQAQRHIVCLAPGAAKDAA